MDKIFSWLGAGFSISAYSLLVIGAIEAHSFLFPFLNLLAALLLSFLLLKNKNKAQFIVNSFYGIISIIALMKYFID